jgi:hypothetical protein
MAQSTAMRITGHRTDSVYRRYRIVDEADIERALRATQRSGQEGPGQQRGRPRRSPPEEVLRGSRMITRNFRTARGGPNQHPLATMREIGAP